MFEASCVIFDLETTGLDPTTCEIIEIGASIFEGGVCKYKFESFVRPFRIVPPNITQLTGITNEMLAFADDVQTVLSEFYDFCGGLPLVAYNLPFDSSFLIKKGEALGIDFMLDGNRLGLDALAVARRCYPSTSHKLQDIVQYLGITVTTAHRAFADVCATKMVLDRCTGFEFTPIVDKKVYGKAQEHNSGLPLF